MATDLERLVVAFEASVTKFERQMAKASGTADRTARKVEARFAKMNSRVEGAFVGIGRGLLAGAAGALSVRALQQYADGWTRVQNQLRVAGLEGTALTSTLDTLYDIAQRNGTAIEPLVTLYGRLSQAQAELGASGSELTQFTEGVSLALRVQGTDAAGASGALLQLSQALGGSVVRAEEFNSIMEGARPILQAVANGLEEAGGSVAKLRQLVVDGELSSQAFFRAFLAGMSGLQQQAASTEGTFSQSFNRMSNAAMKLAGEIDKAGKVSRGFIDIFDGVAGTFDDAAAAAGPLIERLQEINSYLEFMKNIGPIGTLRSLFNNDFLTGWTGSLAPHIREMMENPEFRGESERPPGAGTPLGGTSAARTVSLSDFAVPGDDDGKEKSAEKVSAYEREVAAINKRTEALRMEAQVLGLSTYEAEKARQTQELLTAAREAGMEITPELMQQIDTLAGSYAQATADLEAMTNAQWNAQAAAEDFKATAKDIMSGFISDIRSGVSAADALANALNRILDKLIDIGLNSLFSSGGGGLFGGILSAITGRARGGPVSAGRPYVVGEKRPELFVPNQSGTIMPSVPSVASARGEQTLRIVVEGRPGKEFDAVVSQIAGNVAGPIAASASQNAVGNFSRKGLPGRMQEIQARRF